VVGTADDGTIEAVELAGHTFVLGVQWHPEQDNGDDRLVAALIRSARTRTAPTKTVITTATMPPTPPAEATSTRAHATPQSSTEPKASR
jgi:hypothetical protein